jgi:hypothetical protein
MKMETFLKALREDDFGIGDSFRLGNFEFEVVGTRGRNRVDGDDPIFRQAEFSGGYRGGSGTDDALGELERAALYRLVSGGRAGPRRWPTGRRGSYPRSPGVVVW